MAKTKLHAFVLALVSIVLSVFIVIGWHAPSYPIEFNPPDRGAPGRLIGAGTRFSGDSGTTRGSTNLRQVEIEMDSTILECPFTALVPQVGGKNYGLTLDEYPTFFIHIPKIPGAIVEFTLSGENGEALYHTRYLTAERDATFGISLPRHANVPPLEVDRIYSWQVSLEFKSSSIYVVRGEIERFEATPEFAKTLEEASLGEKVVLYAEASLWYDAVKALADLRRADPGNLQLRADWIELMNAVGLADIAYKPLL
ncbi:DUF928 domain-containing protein [Zarconia navalis]|nr:DUF928 domain-containing protein [Zarconia navalis]